MQAIQELSHATMQKKKKSHVTMQTMQAIQVMQRMT